MNVLVKIVEGFFGLINEGATTFMGIAGGILPNLLILMTIVNLIVRLIGQDRVEKAAEKLTGNIFTRYMILPFIAAFVFTNPLLTVMGRFLKEYQKPGYVDSAESTLHPTLGLFPHINPGEIFVYMGIAIGLEKLGLPLVPFAIRAFLAGMVVILLRGTITERIMLFNMKRAGITIEDLQKEQESLKSGKAELV
jgi:PTS system glucitol/sorbitol-specific IIC component